MGFNFIISMGLWGYFLFSVKLSLLIAGQSCNLLQVGSRKVRAIPSDPLKQNCGSGPQSASMGYFIFFSKINFINCWSVVRTPAGRF